MPSAIYQVGSESIYTAIERPKDELPEEVTGGNFVGRFWVDGSTRISVENEETYLWMYATVHAP